MSEPKMLTIEELKLIRDTQGTVLGEKCCHTHRELWIHDIVYTALELYKERSDNKSRSFLYRLWHSADAPWV